MSSPAQFWKFADIGSTPARPVPDMSPLKGGIEPGDGLGSIPSSSPPPPNLASPSKPGTSNGLGHGRSLSGLKEEDGEREANGLNQADVHEDDEEGDEGFDLAR